MVEVRGSAGVRAADHNIVAMASNGLYRTDLHLVIVQSQTQAGRDPQEVVASHVRLRHNPVAKVLNVWK